MNAVQSTIAGVLIACGLSWAGPIAVTEPNGGQVYAIGDTMHVRWTADTLLTPMVMIEVTVDDGDSWFGVYTQGIDPYNPWWGHYTWVIPDTVRSARRSASTVSGMVRMRIRNYVDQVTNDVSDTTFTILAEHPPAPPSIDDEEDDGCGSGSGAALLPPLVLVAARRWRPRRSRSG